MAFPRSLKINRAEKLSLPQLRSEERFVLSIFHTARFYTPRPMAVDVDTVTRRHKGHGVLVAAAQISARRAHHAQTASAPRSAEVRSDEREGA
jgi:hypothetical protein